MFYSDNEEKRRIDEYLAQQEKNYKGEQIFRLVRADEQFEYREGTYNEFKGDLFVRTVHGIKKTPKYPVLGSCFILEQWFDPGQCQIKEIKDHNGYECIYAFRNGPKHFQGYKPFAPIPLRLVAVQLILKAKREARKSYMLQKSLLQDHVDAIENAADKYTFDAIDPSSPIESALHFKEGVSLAGLEIPGNKNAKTTRTNDELLKGFTSKSGK